MQQVATGYGLIEGPVWDPARGLYFSDVMNGGVFLLDRAGKVSTAVPKRRGIGGMALHTSGGIVVGGRDIACVSLTDGATRSLLALDAIPGATGFNDLTTDQAGRIYVGSLAFKVFGGETPKPGHLHVIDLDGSMRTLSDGVLLTNGLGFLAGRQAPLSLRCARALRARLRCEAGRQRRSVAQVRITRRRQGARWLEGGAGRLGLGCRCPWRTGGGVQSPTGRTARTFAVPLPMVTSLCFAGDDLRDLYIVTGSRGGPHENCGSIFHTRADVPGLPLPPAKVALVGNRCWERGSPEPLFLRFAASHERLWRAALPANRNCFKLTG